MNQIDLKQLTAPPNSWHMLRTLAGVGIFCSLLIVATYQATLPVITAKKIEKLQEAVFNVLPGAASKTNFRLTADGRFEPFEGTPKGETLVYAGYDSQGKLVGIALEAYGQGFQDVLHIIYGYSPEKQAVVGIQVLESKETPGLGDLIEKDPAFLANFEALDVSLGGDGTIQHPITAVKKGEKQQPYQIECITGATISSKAISAILEKSTGEFIPRLMENLATFEK